MPLTVQIELTDQQIMCLKHDLPGEDGIRKWFESAVDGKCYKCRERMIRDGLAVLRADPSIREVPSDKDELCKVIGKHPNYKDRAACERQ